MNNGYMTLLGAEEVSRAGNAISGAADQIQRAATSMDFTVDRLNNVLQEHVQRMEAVAERIERAMAKEPGHG